MRFQFILPDFCPPLCERIKNVANHPRTEIVEMGERYGDGHKISTDPLFTFQVFNCNVVVLFAGDYVAMSHYPGIPMAQERYLPQFLSEVRRDSGTSEVVAVPIAGDDFYHDDVRRILKIERVEIVSEFCDGLDMMLRDEFSDAFFERSRHGFELREHRGMTEQLGEKCVLAIPDTREVLLYSSATKVGSKTLYTNNRR